MGQSLTNGFDVVAVVHEIELQRSIRQQFMEGLARFGLPAELQLAIDGEVLGETVTLQLFGRLGLPDSRLSPSRNAIDGLALDVPETHPNAIEIKIPFIDSALIGGGVGLGGLNFSLSLILDLVRVPVDENDEGLGLDPNSLVVWVEASRTDQDPQGNGLTTRQKLAIVPQASWPVLENSIAQALRTQPFVSDLASALPGLVAETCAVTNSSPTSSAGFDIPSGLQCFDFEIVSDPTFRSLAIKGMLTGTSVSSTVGTPTDPLPLSWAQSSDRAVVIVSNDFLLNEALPRSLMAALLDPLLTDNEDDIRDEVEDDDDIAEADREGEIDRRTEEMRQQTAEEHFSLRPFSMLQSIGRNFGIPLKPEEDEDRNDSRIHSASIASVPDPASTGSTMFRATFHATGGVPGIYSFDADISVLIRFKASGGQVEPEIEAEENPRVDVQFEGIVTAAAVVVGLITGAFTLGIGAIATFMAYHWLEGFFASEAAKQIPGVVDENLGGDVDAELPNTLPVLVRDVEQDDLLLRAELALRDNEGIQWVGVTPLTSGTGFRLDLDHGSPAADPPGIDRRFDAFTGVTAANADVDLVESLVRARNGARLFDFGVMPLARALNVVQGDIRGRSGGGVGSIELQTIAGFTSLIILASDELDQFRVLPAHLIGVVTNEGKVARLIFVSATSGGNEFVTGTLVSRCLYRRYRQKRAEVGMGLELRMSDERRSGVMSDEITVEVTFPTDIGRGTGIGGFELPPGFRDRPTKVVVRVGSEVRDRAFEGRVNMSTTILLQPLRSVVWSVVDRAGVEQTIEPGGPREISVPTDADMTFTVRDGGRGVDFASQLGQSGNFLMRVQVTDYRGTVATDDILVQFFGSRFFTSGFDRVRDLIDLDARLRAREEGLVPGGRGPQPDPSPEDPFGNDGLPTKDGPSHRDGRPIPGQPRRREMAKRSTKASLDRDEFNGPDPRPALFRHLARRSRKASNAKSEAAIERAVAEWTTTIIGLPDATTLVKRHRSRPKPKEAADKSGSGSSTEQDSPKRRDRGSPST